MPILSYLSLLYILGKIYLALIIELGGFENRRDVMVVIMIFFCSMGLSQSLQNNLNHHWSS